MVIGNIQSTVAIANVVLHVITGNDIAISI